MYQCICSYSSCEQYRSVLVPIIHQEVRYQMEEQRSQTTLDIELQWTAPGEAQFPNPWQDNRKTWLCQSITIKTNQLLYPLTVA